MAGRTVRRTNGRRGCRCDAFHARWDKRMDLKMGFATRARRRIRMRNTRVERARARYTKEGEVLYAKNMVVSMMNEMGCL